MKKIKVNNDGDYLLLLDPINEQQLEDFATKPLAEFTLSSTKAYGSHPSLLTYLLEVFNEACVMNKPDVVIGLGKELFKSGATRFIEAPKMEVVLAYARAATMVTDFSFKEVYDYLFKTLYPRKCNNMAEVINARLANNN